MDLHKIFVDTLSQYTQSRQQVDSYWSEIEKHYAKKKRYYHNLSHLQTILLVLQENKNIIGDWNTLVFAVFYHDIIYNVLKNDNEEQSALLAHKRLLATNVPVQIADNCREQILATKAHATSANADANLFTDADLCILGQASAAYETYCKQIRKEYAYFPDLLYKPGRRKVLQHFLDMPRIYKTTQFYHTFEVQARKNLQWELETL